jgi:signal transduction histidine kinase
MPVGSHKDAFKAHQLVKKLAGRDPNAVLADLAQQVLMDFVKNARQVNADHALAALPEDSTQYDIEKCDRALEAVDGLCGKCDESHDDNCFVNQTRRILIRIRTNYDPGPRFDGKKSLASLLEEAEQAALALQERADAAARKTQTGADNQMEALAPGSLAARVASLERGHRELEEKDVFRSTLIDEIAATIERVAAGDFAAEMPVHDDAQLGKLASSFNLMLGTVNRTMRHLDGLVAERSANLRRIMDTAPVGLLSLDEQLRVAPEYSLVCESILGVQDLRGRRFPELIGLTGSRAAERAKLEEFLDLLRQRILPEEDMAPLNPVEEWLLPKRDADGNGDEIPPEMERRKRPRESGGVWIRTRFHLIDRGDATPHFLVTIEDVTRAKEMAAEIAQADRENMQLKIIAEDPDLFCDFLTEAGRITAQVEERLRELDGAGDPRPLVNEMFRGVHTIKGTAATLGLDALSGLAAGLEDAFGRLREEAQIDSATASAARASMEDLKAELGAIVENTGKLLGHDPLGGGDAVLRVSAKALAAQIDRISAMGSVPEAARREIVSALAELRMTPARKGLARALRIVPGLAERLDRQVRFEVEGEDVHMDVDIARALNTPLIHIFRNALDHGIEPPEEREAAGKPPEGSLRCSIRQDNGALEVCVTDDGRGLDPEELRRKAVAKGLMSEAEARALDDAAGMAIIFMPGFSTAETVSDVSGRGVGMDAVRAIIREELGGAVAIESSPGAGASFIIRTPSGMKR